MSAKLTQDFPTASQAAARVKEVKEIETAFTQAKQVRATLAEKPDDPVANLVVGKFTCFYKGDWDKGLPMLVASNDPTLKSLAEKDLANPTESDKQVAVGDGWWTVAETQTGAMRNRTRQRAAKWYKEALPKATGLAKAKIEKRIAEVAKVPDASEPSKAVAAGGGQWITLFTDLDSFQKHWTTNQRNNKVSLYDPRTKAISVEGYGGAGRFSYDGLWVEVSFSIIVRDGGLALNVSGYPLDLAQAFQKLPRRATVKVQYDPQNRRLTASVDGKLAAEKTVKDDSWSQKCICELGASGWRPTNLIISDVRILISKKAESDSGKVER